jgi:hypothetical protein
MVKEPFNFIPYLPEKPMLGAQKKRGRYKNFPPELAPYNKYGLWIKLSSVNQLITETSDV